MLEVGYYKSTPSYLLEVAQDFELCGMLPVQRGAVNKLQTCFPILPTELVSLS